MQHVTLVHRKPEKYWGSYQTDEDKPNYKRDLEGRCLNIYRCQQYLEEGRCLNLCKYAGPDQCPSTIFSHTTLHTYTH